MVKLHNYVRMLYVLESLTAYRIQVSQANLHIQFRQCTFSPGHVSDQPGLIILSNVVHVVINYGIRQNIQERNFRGWSSKGLFMGKCSW